MLDGHRAERGTYPSFQIMYLKSRGKRQRGKRIGSLPSRERGLKLFFPQNSVKNCIPSKHEYELLLRYSVNLFMPFSCS